MTRSIGARVGCVISVFIPSMLFAAAAPAAATFDGNLGTAPLAGPDYMIPDTAGQTRGANLFHSFGQFSLATGESATFTGPASIQNIIGRVTGGELSSIDGRISSQIQGANLYLINPSGITFGPNASLDVSGAFHASTADYLRLADGGRFDARDPGASNLTVAAPAAFGFLGTAPAPLRVDGATLSVPTGRQLSLVGGNIDIIGSAADVPSLLAPGGRLNVAAVASAGEAVPTSADLDVGSFTGLGTINMSNSAFLDARGDPGGAIFIRGGRFIIDNSGADFSQFATHSALSAASTGGADHLGTAIDVRVTEDISVHGGEISASSFGAGRGGDIRIEAGSIELFGAAPSTAEPFGRSSIVAARVFSSGGGGDIVLASRDVTARDGAGVVAQVFGTGTGGDIAIEAQRLEISGQDSLAFVSAATFAAGNAGNLAVTAEEVLLRGGPGGFTGLTTQVASSSQANANAGTLSLTATRLEVLDGAQVSAGIFSGNGAGGSVRISADEIYIAGRNPGGFSAGIFTDVNGIPTTGVGGDIEITARDLQMADRGQIAASAGLTQGAAGNVSISAENVSLGSGAVITSQTFGTRDAGDVSIDARQVRLTGPSPTGAFTGVFALAGINGGNAGEIRIRADDVHVLNGGQVDSSTTGGGAGGTVDIQADRVLIAGRDDANDRRAAIGASTRVFSTFGSLATGRGGDVSVQAREVVLQDQGLISVESSSLGNGGNLRVSAANVSLSGGSSMSAVSSGSGNAGNIDILADALRLRDSDISTRADQADGGNVSVVAGPLVHLHQSAISASVGGGAGNGGNIAIDPDFVVLNGSRITADAVGGNGGNISIIAGQFVASPDSRVSASSTFGLQGEVVIRAPSADISGELERLPEAILDAAARFKSGCAAAGSGFSRFTASAPVIAAPASAGMPSDYARIGVAASSEVAPTISGRRGGVDEVVIASSSNCVR